MIKEFPGYYNNDTNKVKELWDNCFFIFDTNVILNFIRYPIQYLNFFEKFINKYNKQIHLPYQVAEEYHKNVFSEINKQEKSYEKIIDEIGIEKICKKLEAEYLERHPTINIKDIINELEKCNKEISKILETSKTNHYNSNGLMNKIAGLLEDKIGERFSKTDLNTIFKEGEDRYNNDIPPGYLDKNKSHKNRQYGDLILWKSIIKFSKQKDTNIIFICDDKKDDWYLKIDSKSQGRPELINEFYEETQRQIFIMTSKYLINLPKEISEIEQDTNSLSAINNFDSYDLILKKYKPLFITNMSKEIKIMKNWFYKNFEDPINAVPYDSEDDEYFYTVGGNTNVFDALYEEFEDIYSEELIEETAQEIISETGLDEWVKKGLY